MAEIRDKRIQVMMTAEELDLLDRWRFGQMIGSRSDAMRRLAMDAVRREMTAPPPEPRAKRSEK